MKGTKKATAQLQKARSGPLKALAEFRALRYLLVSVLLLPVLFFRPLTRLSAWQMFLILGLVLVVALVGVVWIWRGRRAKSGAAEDVGEKDAPSEEEQALHAALREKFAEGVATIRKHGKGLYSLPTFLVVGERGMGKTEALRGSRVGFPAELMDTSQGEGGTELLDWWFTNRAILIDFPGRFFLNGSENGGNGLWETLLELLAKHRPACPLNGVVLAISADSLLLDSEEVIAKKAADIVRRLEGIYQALGIQLPVYLLVTKADKITGFSQFFGDLSDQVDRDQLLGWSNPDPVGTPFNSHSLHEHVADVCGRLSLRRDALLKDSTDTGDLTYNRRIRMHNLFEFPGGYRRVSAKLGLYIEKIFGEEAWFSEPFFLRGYYFTSAMQGARGVDCGLADLLGSSASAMPESGAQQERNSFFLKDLFIDKVFKERGLVSWKHDTKWRRKRRWATWFGLLSLAVLMLIACTFYQASRWESAIETPRNYWVRVHQWMTTSSGVKEIVSEIGPNRYEYNGAVEVVLSSNAKTRLGLLPRDAFKWLNPVPPPVVFRPIHAFHSQLDTDVRNAHHNLFEAVYLLPIVQAATTDIHYGAAPWSDDATNALAQLLRLEAAASHPEQRISEGVVLRISDLFLYVLQDESQIRLYSNDKNHVEGYVARIYPPAGDAVWPPAILMGDKSRGFRVTALENGVASFAAFIDSALHSGAAFQDLHDLYLALLDFKRTEDLLWKVAVDELADAETPSSSYEIEILLARWREGREELLVRKETLDDALSRLLQYASKDIVAVCAAERDRVRKEVTDKYFALLDELDNETASPDTDEQGGNALRRVKQQLEESRTASLQIVEDRSSQFLDDFMTIDSEEQFLKVSEYRGLRRYALRTHVYGYAEPAKFAPTDTFDPFEYLFDFEEIQRAFDEQAGAVANLDTNSARYGGAMGATKEMLELVFRQRRFFVVARILDALPTSAKGFNALVLSRAEDDWSLRPDIPLTDIGLGPLFNKEFNTEVVYELLHLWDEISTTLKTQGRGRNLLPDADRMDMEFAEKGRLLSHYLSDYLNYWTRVIDRDTEIGLFESWDRFYPQLRSLDVEEVNHKLREVYEHALYALDIVPPTQEGQAEAHRMTALKLSRLDEGFNQLCQQMLGKWLAFEKVDRAAVATILDLPADIFEYEFLGALTQSGYEAMFPYWNSLCSQATHLFAEEGEKLAFHYLCTLAKDFKAIPLCLDSDAPALSSHRIQEAYELSRHLKQPAKDSEPGTIKAGQRTGLPDIDLELDRMQGDFVIDSDDGRAWQESLLNVLDFLHGGGPLRVELAVLDDASQSRRPLGLEDLLPSEKAFGAATWVYRYMRVNGVPMNTVSTEAMADELKRLPLSADHDRLDMAFYYNSQDLLPGMAEQQKTNGLGSLEEIPWLPVTVLHRADAVVMDDNLRARVPVSVIDVDLREGGKYYYWIEFAFNKTIPSVDAWPSMANWPELGEMPAESQERTLYLGPEDATDPFWNLPATPKEEVGQEVPFSVPFLWPVPDITRKEPGPTLPPVELDTGTHTGQDAGAVVDVPDSSGPALEEQPSPVAAFREQALDTPPTLATQYEPPTVSLEQAPDQQDPTNAFPIVFDVDFEEPVQGFQVGANSPDVSFLGTASGITYVLEGSDGHYEILVTDVLGDGTVVPVIPNGVCSDLFGNANTTSFSEDNSVLFDGTPPVLSLATTARDPTNASSFELAVTASEAIYGFEDEDLLVPNAQLRRISGDTGDAGFRFLLTPLDDGPVSVGVAPSALTDAVGNLNKAAESFSITYDNTGPSVSFSSYSTPSATNESVIRLRIAFSEPIAGLAVSDLRIANAAARDLAGSDGGLIYTLDLRPKKDGPVTVDLPAAATTDLIGNPSLAAPQFIRVYDSTRPSVEITSTAADPTGASTIPITVRFSESVMGFSDEHLKVANAEVVRTAGTGGDLEYSFDLMPLSDGPVTASVASKSVQDAAGNKNRRGASFSVSYDGVAPDVRIASRDTPQDTNRSPIPVKAVFSEAVTDFDAASIAAVNGTVVHFQRHERGKQFDFGVTPLSDGRVSVQIPANVARDVAGVGNTASAELSWTFDSTPPVGTFSSATADPTSETVFGVQIAFDEAVYGLEAADIQTKNATLANFTGDDGARVYRFDLRPEKEGVVLASYSAGAATDATGNETRASHFACTFVPPAPVAPLPQTQEQDKTKREEPVLVDEAQPEELPSLEQEPPKLEVLTLHDLPDAQTPESPESPESPGLAPASFLGPFTIYAGAFPSSNAAKKRKTMLERESKLDGEVVSSISGQEFLVFVGAFAARPEAEAACKRLHEQTGLRSCLVIERRKR